MSIMTRAIWIVAITVLVGSAVQSGRWLSAEEPTVPVVGIVSEPASDPLPGLPVGYETPVTLSAMRFAASRPSEAHEWREQVRDWLLMLVLSAARLDAHALADATYEVPGLRTSYAETVGEFQHGPVRSVSLPSGALIVLVPAGQNSGERSDAIASAADRHVIRVGSRPATVHVVEYCIDEAPGPTQPQNWRLSLVRRAPIDGQRVFTTEFGWVSTGVTTQANLAAVVQSIDDLISVRVTSSGVTVEGRSYRARRYGRITVEHIATIWQAYEHVDLARQRDQLRYNAFIDVQANRFIDSVIAREPKALGAIGADSTLPLSVRIQSPELLNQVRQRVHRDVESIRRQRRSCAFAFTVADLRQRATRTPSEAESIRLLDAVVDFDRAIPESERSLLRGSLGFSLDAAYRYQDLSNAFERFLVDGPAALTEALSQHRGEIASAIRSGDERLLRCHLLQAVSSRTPMQDEARLRMLREANHALFGAAAYQVARYDGGLAGTEVGQILFYTDLLAKLYGMDLDGAATTSYGRSIPQWTPTVFRLPDFVHQAQDARVPETRIWFGLRNDAFRLTPGMGAVFFAQTATRVFALSRAVADDQTEVQPNSLDQQWVGFFNNHYNEISGHEIRYDQLNQITKWSLALDFIRTRAGFRGFQLLDELAREEVRRDLWFPSWVRASIPGGAEVAWLRCFEHEARSSPGAVETMSVVHVRWNDAPPAWCGGEPREFDVWGDVHFGVQGGVTLPRVERVGFRQADAGSRGWRPQLVRDGFSSSTSQVNARFAPEYGYQRHFEIRYAPGGSFASVVRTARAVTQNADGTTTEVGRSVLHRGPGVEVRPTTFRDALTVSRDRAQLTVEATTGDGALARISFNTQDRAFSIEQQSLGRELAQGIAVNLSRTPQRNWAARLLDDARVQALVQPDESTFLVQLRTGDWMEFARQPADAVQLPAEWHARAAADTNSFALSLGVRPDVVLSRHVTEAALQARLATHAALELRRTPRERMGDVIQIRGPPNQPPPPGGPGLAFGSPEDPFRGRFNRSGSQAYIETGGRPIPLNNLLLALRAVDIEFVRSAPESHVVQLAAPEARSAFTDQSAALRDSLQSTLQAGLRDSPEATLSAIARIRADYPRAIRAAREEGPSRVAEDLAREFRSAFLPTPGEALAHAADVLRASGRHIDESLVNTLRAAAEPQAYGAELARRAGVAGERGGADAWRQTVQTDHLFVAQAVQQRLGTGVQLRLKADSPDVVADLGQPRRVRRASRADLDRARLIFATEELRLNQLSQPETIALLERDLFVVEIEDPARRISIGLQATIPDEVTLGPQLVFRLARTDAPKPSAATFARGDDEWLRAYSSFASRLGAGMFCGSSDGGVGCTPPYPPDGSTAGNGSGGGTSGGGADPSAGALTTADGTVLFLTTTSALSGRTCPLPGSPERERQRGADAGRSLACVAAAGQRDG